jgi:hypothetical protein
MRFSLSLISDNEELNHLEKYRFVSLRSTKFAIMSFAKIRLPLFSGFQDGPLLTFLLYVCVLSKGAFLHTNIISACHNYAITTKHTEVACIFYDVFTALDLHNKVRISEHLSQTATCDRIGTGGG